MKNKSKLTRTLMVMKKVSKSLLFLSDCYLFMNKLCLIYAVETSSINKYTFFSYFFCKSTPIFFRLLTSSCRIQRVISESPSALYSAACFRLKEHCSVECFHNTGKEIIRPSKWPISASRAISRVDKGCSSK